MTIHHDHPFRDPMPDPVRRFRGRLGGGVTLWTADGPAGLTVSSVLVAAGEPAHLVALLDPDADLTEALQETGVAAVQVLRERHRMLTEVFADLAPAPGGKFMQARFVDTTWGPRLADAPTWAGVRLLDGRPVGWSLLVTCAVEHLEVGEEDDTLLQHRGRLLSPGGG